MTLARRDAALPYERLLDDLRSNTLARWAPPGGGTMGALTHTVIHGIDLTSTLGLARTNSDEACRLVLDLLVAADPFGVDASGHELQVSDLPWRHGTGPVIEAGAGDVPAGTHGQLIRRWRSPPSATIWR